MIICEWNLKLKKDFLQINVGTTGVIYINQTLSYVEYSSGLVRPLNIWYNWDKNFIGI